MVDVADGCDLIWSLNTRGRVPHRVSATRAATAYAARAPFERGVQGHNALLKCNQALAEGGSGASKPNRHAKILDRHRHAVVAMTVWGVRAGHGRGRVHGEHTGLSRR